MNVRAAAVPFTPAPMTAAVSASSRPSVSAASTPRHPCAAMSRRPRRGSRRAARSRRPRAERGRLRSAALLRVARERRHPLERRVTAAERGHRAEVAGRVRGHVDLGRHRPFASLVRHERVADERDSALRRHGGGDVSSAKERNRAQSALTAETSASTDDFASPNSIEVFGSTNSGFRCRRSPASWSAEHDDVLRVVDVEDRHAVDRAARVAARGRVRDVVRADDERHVRLLEGG